MKANDGVNYNRNYKDTLFRKLFGENRENALSLYNAVNGTHYTNAEDLEFTTLDDVVYMKMKNDVSFIFGNYIEPEYAIAWVVVFCRYVSSDYTCE